MPAQPRYLPRQAAQAFKTGGGKGIRTPGLLIANETLYQLSYTPGGMQTSTAKKFFQ